MGLALVRKFVEMHNGEIQVESEEGKGSVFTLTMPKSYVNMQNTGVYEPGDTYTTSEDEDDGEKIAVSACVD